MVYWMMERERSAGTMVGVSRIPVIIAGIFNVGEYGVSRCGGYWMNKYKLLYDELREYICDEQPDRGIHIVIKLDELADKYGIVTGGE